MIGKIFNYLGQWVTSSNSSPTPNETPTSPTYTSSFSSFTSDNKGKRIVGGLLALVGLIILVWRNGWNPIQKLFGKTEAVENKAKVEEFEIEDWITCPIAQGTRLATQQWSYTAPSGRQIALCSGEQLYKQSMRFSNTLDPTSVETKFTSTEVVVVEGDCLEVAEKEQKEGNRVAVLVFASPIEPGGAMAEGNNGQEEEICRRSNLFSLMWELLYNSDTFSGLYPLVDLTHAAEEDPLYSQKSFNGMFITHDVTVFRSGKDKSYAFLEDPFDIGMLVSPALRKPKLTDKNSYLREEDQTQMKKVIMTQLRVSHEQNYDTVVLGAFGCGAFQNPPALIAQLYKDIIDEHFQGAFKKLIFPILDNAPKGRHNPEGNLKPFKACFGID